MDSVLFGLVIIVVLGVLSQAIAWFTRIPSILLLIAVGFIAGPVLNIIQPDVLLGDLLEPIVELSVAVILFEGGLNLKLSEIKTTASVVLRLISLGVVITWAIGILGAIFILGMEPPLAVLLGAILVVSGPTVIMPLLRYLRPGANVSAVLKWEGILVDPIGAILGIIVLEVILAGGGTGAAVLQVLGIVSKSVISGVVLGGLGGLAITFLLKRYIIPDYLHVPVTLGILAGVFLASELIQPQAGLLTAIIMGGVLANQRQISISHILEFKENLQILLISFIFIILSARLKLSLFEPLSLTLILFILLLVLVARPLCVFLSSVRSKIKFKEKWLLSVISPRGIVSAAIASVFAFRLTGEGYAGAELLLPVTFSVVFGTILISSIGAPIVIKGLKISQMNPQGVVFVGCHVWLRDIAALLDKEGIKCMLVTANKTEAANARRRKLKASYADVLNSNFLEKTDFSDYGYAVAATSDSNYDALVALRLSKEFGRSNVYMLPVEEAGSNNEHFTRHLPGRTLFDQRATHSYITQLYEKGSIKIKELEEDTTLEKTGSLFGMNSLPMFVIDSSGNLAIIAAGTNPELKAGSKIIALVSEDSSKK